MDPLDPCVCTPLNAHGIMAHMHSHPPPPHTALSGPTPTFTTLALTAPHLPRPTGRVLIGQGGVDGQKIALTIAIKYALQRTQFGGKLIMEYLSHQTRLLPALAGTYALHFGQKYLKDVIERKRPEDAKVIHVLSSGIKAVATWTRVETMQNCRK